MTSEEIRSMTPGPEMDAALRSLDERIAIDLMGWKPMYPPGERPTGWHGGGGTREDGTPYVTWIPGAWSPSTNPGAAWEMETEIERRGLADLYAEHLTREVSEWTSVKTVGGENFSAPTGLRPFNLAHATPEQRCRAALLALAAAGK